MNHSCAFESRGMMRLLTVLPILFYSAYCFSFGAVQPGMSRKWSSNQYSSYSSLQETLIIEDPGEPFRRLHLKADYCNNTVTATCENCVVALRNSKPPEVQSGPGEVVAKLDELLSISFVMDEPTDELRSAVEYVAASKHSMGKVMVYHIPFEANGIVKHASKTMCPNTSAQRIDE